MLLSRREYLVKAEHVLGHLPSVGAIIHHVDQNRQNNRNDNLVILQNQIEHAQLHRRLRIKRAGGNPWTQQICGQCRKVKDLTEFSPSTRLLSKHKTVCKLCAVVQVRKGRPYETKEERSARSSLMANRRWEAYRATLRV
jgi:hypothetical protein